MMLDLAEEVGLELPPPEGASYEMLDTLAPGLILPTNPVDLTAQPLVDPELYIRALPPLANDARYGSVVLGMILSSPAMAARKTEPVLKAIRSMSKRPSRWSTRCSATRRRCRKTTSASSAISAFPSCARPTA